MKRFFVDDIDIKKGTFSIRGSEARHMNRVMRMGSGDRFILMDGRGARFQAVIQSATPREVSGFLEKGLPVPRSSPVEIVLCQGLLKSGPMDYAVQKSSELGVTSIAPFFSERTVVRLEGERTEKKIKRWREIARNATKQSDRRTPPGLGAVCSFGELTRRWKGEEGLKVILWEEEGTKDLKGVLRLYSGKRRFIGLVGPEGGFTKDEIAAARESGFISVSMGDRILRAETAAIAVVAIVQYEWGDLSLSRCGQ